MRVNKWQEMNGWTYPVNPIMSECVCPWSRLWSDGPLASTQLRQRVRSSASSLCWNSATIAQCLPQSGALIAALKWLVSADGHNTGSSVPSARSWRWASGAISSYCSQRDKPGFKPFMLTPFLQAPVQSVIWAAPAMPDFWKSCDGIA